MALVLFALMMVVCCCVDVIDDLVYGLRCFGHVWLVAVVLSCCCIQDMYIGSPLIFQRVFPYVGLNSSVQTQCSKYLPVLVSDRTDLFLFQGECCCSTYVGHFMFLLVDLCRFFIGFLNVTCTFQYVGFNSSVQNSMFKVLYGCY